MFNSILKSVSRVFANNYKDLCVYLARWGAINEDGYRMLRFVNSGEVLEFMFIPEKNILQGKIYNLHDYNDKKVNCVEMKEIIIYENGYLRLVKSIYNKSLDRFDIKLDEKTNNSASIAEFLDDFKSEHEMADYIIVGNSIEYFYNKERKKHCLGYNLENEDLMRNIKEVRRTRDITGIAFREAARCYNEKYNIVIHCDNKEDLGKRRNELKGLIEATITR